MDRHPDSSLVAQLGRGRLSRRRSREIVRHLLAACQECCRSVASRYLSPLRLAAASATVRFDYSQAFVRAGRTADRRRIALAAERAEAPALLQEVLAQPPERRRNLLLGGARFRTWAFCEHLLDAGRELLLQDPARAVDLSLLGVETAMRLEAAVHGEARVNDLRARAWAVLGNAQRVRGDFPEAEESFAQADRRLKQGTGDPLEKAHALLLKSSLRGSQHRFREAFRLLDRVEAIGRRCDDARLCGKALIVRGLLVGVAKAEMERATLSLIRDVSKYLQDSRAARSQRSRDLR
jgi:tetratricopeptide (TPR) repeat protein